MLPSKSITATTQRAMPLYDINKRHEISTSITNTNSTLRSKHSDVTFRPAPHLGPGDEPDIPLHLCNSAKEDLISLLSVSYYRSCMRSRNPTGALACFLPSMIPPPSLLCFLYIQHPHIQNMTWHRSWSHQNMFLLFITLLSGMPLVFSWV